MKLLAIIGEKLKSKISLRGSQIEKPGKILTCEGRKFENRERYWLARVANQETGKDIKLRGSQVIKLKNDINLLGSQVRKPWKIFSCVCCKSENHERYPLARIASSKTEKDIKLRGSQVGKLKKVSRLRGSQTHSLFSMTSLRPLFCINQKLQLYPEPTSEWESQIAIVS